MALPWLSILDTALGLANMARGRKSGALPDTADRQLDIGSRALGGIETRLAGVVVAALKEAFDRDTRRLELEREQIEGERRRAERALALELLRQAGDREIARLRLLGGVAVASFVGTLFLATRVLSGGSGSRVLLGIGWALLLAAVAATFTAQSHAAEAIQREGAPVTFGGRMAPWMIVAALAAIGGAVLVS
jgi:hypothetical protein